MIEDKKLGLKIAENPNEALWSAQKKITEAEIKRLKDALVISEAFIEMCNEKLEEAKHEAVQKT